MYFAWYLLKSEHPMVVRTSCLLDRQLMLPFLARTYCRYLLVGFEVSLPDGSPATEAALKIVKAMLRRGFILLPEGERSNVLGFTPPLTISPNQLQAAVAALAELLAQ